MGLGVLRGGKMLRRRRREGGCAVFLGHDNEIWTMKSCLQANDLTFVSIQQVIALCLFLWQRQSVLLEMTWDQGVFLTETKRSIPIHRRGLGYYSEDVSGQPRIEDFKEPRGIPFISWTPQTGPLGSFFRFQETDKDRGNVIFRAKAVGLRIYGNTRDMVMRLSSVFHKRAKQ